MARRRASADYGLIHLLLHLGNGEKTAMCGRFEQSETPRYYADALSAHISKRLKTLGDNRPSYNVAPGQSPWMIMLHRIWSARGICSMPARSAKQCCAEYPAQGVYRQGAPCSAFGPCHQRSIPLAFPLGDTWSCGEELQAGQA
jgi:hypothetical protein